jgi:quinolinate synthase
MSIPAEQISALKKEKNAVILAHFYQDMQIQEIADFVGDSFDLSRRAMAAEADVIVFCGVRFMAESAKILNPERTVLLPVDTAGCPMADMVAAEDVRALRRQHPDAAVCCYVNSTAEVKAESDICCTSSSAEAVVRSLSQKKIIFIPDRNLGAYIAAKVPEKDIILFNGCCPIHDAAKLWDFATARAAHPHALFAAHPECRADLLENADYIGSTKGIIDFVLNSDVKEFIIGTENGVVERLKLLAPNKKCYPLSERFVCVNMKKTKLEDVEAALRLMQHEIILPRTLADRARLPLERMIRVQ